MVGMSSNPASELAQLLEPSLHSFKAIADLALEEQRPLSDYVAQGVDFAWHALAAPTLLEQVVRYLTEQRNLTPTADNVTDKLISAGRNANRRQVLFVVKGLALKGHVFSTTDTPERVA